MGATSPLPAAIAVAFAEAGADVAVTSTTPDAEEAFELRRLRRRVTDLGRRGLAESVDLGIGTNVQIAVRQASKELGGIDVLVLAPDLRLTRPAERLSDAEWSRVLGYNLSGVFYACRAVAREMLNRDAGEGITRGHILVLLPSIEVLTAEDDAAYAAAKAGALGLVRALRREWAGRGIVVRAVTLPSEPDNDTIAELALTLAGG